MSASWRILIVDDEAAIRTSLAAFLEDYGHEVTITDSAERALSLFQEQQFDIAVVDLRLPGMTGDLLIQQAKKLNIPVRFLIHTGSVDFALPDELKEIGMLEEHVLNKPQPDLNRFIDTLEELMKDKARCP